MDIKRMPRRPDGALDEADNDADVDETKYQCCRADGCYCADRSRWEGSRLCDPFYGRRRAQLLKQRLLVANPITVSRLCRR